MKRSAGPLSSLRRCATPNNRRAGAVVPYDATGRIPRIHHRHRRSGCPPYPSFDSPISRIVDVSDLARRMRSRVREYAAANKVSLVGILAGQSHAAETYSDHIAATLRDDGLQYTLHRCSGDSPEDVKAAIAEMNHRSEHCGILVFYPIFPQRTASFENDSFYVNPNKYNSKRSSSSYYLNPATGVHYKTVDDYLRDCVDPSKDVEGLRHNSKHRQLFRARAGGRLPNDAYIPCTVTAVLKILDAYHIMNEPITSHDRHNRSSTNEQFRPFMQQHQQRWKGCTVTVINRSTILGRPLAALLALEGALVYSVDDTSIIQFRSGGGRMRRCSRDVTLSDCLRQSSVIVTAVPGADFCLDSAAIQDNATIVDVSEQSNVDIETILQQKSGVQLIPSVGKVTIAALEHNLIRLHHQQTTKTKSA